MCSPDQFAVKWHCRHPKFVGSWTSWYFNFMAGVTAIDFLSSKHSVSMYLENHNLSSVFIQFFIIMIYLQLWYVGDKLGVILLWMLTLQLTTYDVLHILATSCIHQVLVFGVYLISWQVSPPLVYFFKTFGQYVFRKL